MRMRSVVLILSLLSTVGGLRGQEPQVRRPFREAATVPVDTTVAKSLGQVEEFAAAGRWQDAIEILQQLTETHGEALTQIEPGRTGGTAWYANVATRASILLARLPSEARDGYRARLDPLAREWFEEWETTRREGSLRRILRTAFLSSYGDDALWNLGEAAWDRGDFEAARRLWTQLVPIPAEFDDDRFPGVLRYPDAEIGQAEIRARLILCSLMQDEHERARREFEQFSREFPEARGTLGGQTGKFTEILQSQLETLRTNRPLPWSGDFLTFGGRMNRQWVAAKVPDLATPKWFAELRRNVLPLWFRQVLQRDGGPLAYHPVIWRDLVLVADEGSVSAWNLLTGEPAWSTEGNQRAEIYPAVPEDRESAPDRPSLGLPHYTLTIDDGKLYARMGWPVTSPSRRELRTLTSTLICLDLEHGQGQLQWMVSSEDLPADDGPPWSWEGTPVVVQGRVYAVACRRRPQLELAVVCVEPTEGQIEWMRSVCTGRPQAEEDFNRISHLLLSAAEGRLFVSTDAGVILALDASDGRLEWAVTYETAMELGGFRQRMPGFSLLPCIVHDGRVYAAPNDSDRILCLEATTGRTIWNRAMPERIRSLIGVATGGSRDLLITSGRSLWAFDVRTGDTVWRDFSDERGYGQGVLCDDQVLWPTREALLVFDVDSGRLRRRIELATPDREGTGGNLAVAPGWIVVAEPTRLVVYWEYSGQKRKLLEGLSHDPYDHRLRLRLAQLDAALGDRESARKEWQRVLDIADRAGAPEVRTACEAAWLAWAERWSRSSAAAGQPEAGTHPLREVFEKLTSPELRDSAARELALRELERGPAGDPVSPLMSVLRQRPQLSDATRRVLLRVLTEGATDVREQYAGVAGPDWPFSEAAVKLAVAEGVSTRPRRQARATVALLKSAAGWPIAADLQDAAGQTVERLESRLTEPADSAPEFHGTPWWTMAWERSLLSGENVVLLQPRQHPSHARILLVSDRLTAIDPKNGRERWSRALGKPLKEILVTADAFLLVQPDTLSLLDQSTGELIWRTELPSLFDGLRLESPEVQLSDSVVVVKAAGRKFVAVNVLTGDELWRGRPPSGDLQNRWSVREGRIWCQTLKPDHSWSCRIADGVWEEPRWGLDRAWQSNPVVDESLTVGVIGDDHVIHTIPTGEVLRDRRFAGPLSHAHVDPVLKTDGQRWWVVVDGLSFSRFDPLTGIPLGSAALTDWPLRGRPAEITWGQHRVWCAADGVLRGALLDDPSDVLSLPLPGEGRWRVAVVASPDRQSRESIWTWRADDPHALTVVDESSGQLRQRLPLPRDAGAVQVAATVSGAAVSGTRFLRGYSPIDRITTAAVR